MNRKSLAKIHLAATMVAAITIVTFFTTSLTAELSGDFEIIKQVKFLILCVIPLLIVAMAVLNITGTKLAGETQNIQILAKKKRMKWMMVNGVGLISLAVFLFYQSHYRNMNSTFILAQIAEFILGLANLILISLNVKSGLKLSGKLKS